MRKKYNHKNCQSLFGYAAEVHARSGGICQLCDAGSGMDVSSDIYFDFWRQLSVEHLIGKSQGGYPKQVRQLLDVRFPDSSGDVLDELAGQLDEANTVTACSFCNSATSHDQNGGVGMAQLLGKSSDPREAVAVAVGELAGVRERKRREIVEWKLASVREEFDRGVRSRLSEARLRRRKR